MSHGLEDPSKSNPQKKSQRKRFQATHADKIIHLVNKRMNDVIISTEYNL